MMTCGECDVMHDLNNWSNKSNAKAAPEEEPDSDQEEPDSDQEEPETDFDSLSYAELKVLAKEAEIPNYYRTGREDLIELLREEVSDE